ncbi:MAG: OmpA family protein [Bdellovibrionales bacterium]|nr:OmpA family protein [Bdellovibrionales bacterium]
MNANTPLSENKTQTIQQDREHIKTKHTFFVNTLVVAACSGLIACASKVKKVDIASGSNPVQELTNAETKSKELVTKQYDRLSPNLFEKAQDSIAEAREGVQDSDDSDDILEDVGQALGYLREVEANGEKYSKSLETVLAARQNALDAGAHQLMGKELKKADNELADVGEDIEDGDYEVDAKTLARLENNYLDVELRSLKAANLGESQSLIAKAVKNDGDDKAPQSYQEAVALFKSAEKSIEANRRQPSAYTEAVSKALFAANKLNKVTDIAREKKINEAGALTIFEQDLKLQDTSESLARMQERNKSSNEKLSALAQKNNEYAVKETMEKRIAEAKKQFAANEAEVLQDNDKLIVRLRKVNFDTARSEVKPDSYATLEKVKQLFTVVPDAQVTVEGHTDSVGSAKVNKTLSEKRAESVKKYFVSQNAIEDGQITAEGYGFEKPLTTNKTKQGRATNRRVDIIIESKSIQ